MVSYPELDRLNPEWPTPRVAKLYRKFLKKQEPLYRLPISEQDAPQLSVIPSIKALRDRDWDQSAAGHLLGRTMIGPTYNDIIDSTNSTLNDTVNTLLEELEMPEPPGDWVEDPAPAWDQLNDDEVDEIMEQYRDHMGEMATWWIIRMTQNSNNITEQMTLFWHNFFATAQSKVFYPQAMYEQNKIFRQHGLGNFKELLRRVTFGPAMMIWLDIHRSKKHNPNENFSRELMELFTLGVDNYTQNDIVEASKAFTGYVTDGVETNYDYENQVGTDIHWDEWHDFGNKTVLGQTGQWTGDDIINILLEQEECAKHICRRIYKWFVYENVHEPVVEEMADILRDNDYEVRPALEFLFKSEHFYDNNFRGAMIQNPIGFLPGLVRKFGMENFTYPDGYLLRSVAALGMTPLEPPDVNGWTGYRSWINSITLPRRKLGGCSLVTGFSPFGGFDFTVDVRSMAQTMYSSDDEGYASEQIVRKLALVLFGVPLSNVLETRMLEILLDGAEPYDWNINAPEGDAQWNRMKDLLLYMIRLPEIQIS
ncbi:MAG: DUF1800 domain-containing protein [Candidatus Marinimicrobia bacterium]|nr:DUF1800 domain-containing protein [Candidatus Neomarinimicrobiota bacterium]